MANKHGKSVKMLFNDIPLEARPGSCPTDIIRSYQDQSEARHARIEAERDVAQFREQAAKAKSEGLPPFNVSDRSVWDSWVDANKDPYGACTMRYAARWANYMEREIAGGKSLEQIAEKASHDADLEGVTGFMYGCAVGMLSKAWKHGEELRRWHNLKTQIGDEGEKANRQGGVLNPALLSIGTSPKP